MSAKPTTEHMPFSDHRSMEQVIADEARGCLCELVERFGDAPDCQFVQAFEREAE